MWVLLFFQLVMGQTLEDLFLEKEQVIFDLRDQILDVYNRSCDISCETCSLSACESNQFDLSSFDLTCVDDFGHPDECSQCEGGKEGKEGRRLNFNQSTVRTATSVITDQMKYEMCWTKRLDSQFQLLKDDLTLKWQYFGTPTSTYRIYPGVSQETCYTYDPRIRPWYVAATSGPKDVILLIDTSGSMGSYQRMDITKTAVKSVLSTLTVLDFFSVVEFNSDARSLTGDTLIQASSENLDSVKDEVDYLYPDGGTNFEMGFNSAFDLLDNSNEYSSNCHRTILFLTDGEITEGIEGQQIVNLINERNLNHSATIFTYSLGANADNDIPKRIACSNNGIWAPIIDGGDVRGKMNQYYEYFSVLRNNQDRVVWVEPYLDATGAGEMTTGSLTVYDHSVDPPLLIGVIGVDVLTQDIIQIEPNYDSLLRALISRSYSCPDNELSECQIENLRGLEADSLFLDPSDLQCGVNCSDLIFESVRRTCNKDYPDWCNLDTFDYLNLTCCSNCNSPSSYYSLEYGPILTSSESKDPESRIGKKGGSDISNIVIIVTIILTIILLSCAGCIVMAGGKNDQVEHHSTELSHESSNSTHESSSSNHESSNSLDPIPEHPPSRQDDIL